VQDDDSAGFTEQRFGANLRDAREAAGLSQAEVAEQMNELGMGFRFTQQVVGKIEAGKRPLRLREALMLASVTRASLDVLARPRHASGYAWPIITQVRNVRHWHQVATDSAQHYSGARRMLKLALDRAREAGLAETLANEMLIGELALTELAPASEEEARGDE
jgi:transcriptional regulator with XRE-family HTH domain